jgi:hypothetical protein
MFMTHPNVGPHLRHWTDFDFKPLICSLSS